MLNIFNLSSYFIFPVCFIIYLVGSLLLVEVCHQKLKSTAIEN